MSETILAYTSDQRLAHGPRPSTSTKCVFPLVTRERPYCRSPRFIFRAGGKLLSGKADGNVAAAKSGIVDIDESALASTTRLELSGANISPAEPASIMLFASELWSPAAPRNRQPTGGDPRHRRAADTLRTRLHQNGANVNIASGFQSAAHEIRHLIWPFRAAKPQQLQADGGGQRRPPGDAAGGCFNPRGCGS